VDPLREVLTVATGPTGEALLAAYGFRTTKGGSAGGARPLPTGHLLTGRRGDPHRLPEGLHQADVVSLDELKSAGSMLKARELGKVRMEGKDYVMQDGDVVEFRFDV
jgi:ribosome-binding ATPase